MTTREEKLETALREARAVLHRLSMWPQDECACAVAKIDGALLPEPPLVTVELANNRNVAVVMVGDVELCRVCRLGTGVWLEKPGSQPFGCGEVLGDKVTLSLPRA